MKPKLLLCLALVLVAAIGCEMVDDDDKSGTGESAGQENSLDEIDISNARMLYSTVPDIHEWPITSVKAPFESRGMEMLCEWDKRLVWPTSPKNRVNANVVVFYWLDGILYGCPQEYITRDNPWRPMKFWLPDGKGGQYRPTKGTVLGLMISGISRTGEPHNIEERTQVQRVVWPVNS